MDDEEKKRKMFEGKKDQKVDWKKVAEIINEGKNGRLESNVTLNEKSRNSLISFLKRSNDSCNDDYISVFNEKGMSVGTSSTDGVVIKGFNEGFQIDVSVKDGIKDVVVKSIISEKSSVNSVKIWGKSSDSINNNEYISLKGEKKVKFTLDWDNVNNDYDNNNNDNLSNSMEESIFKDKGFITYFDKSQGKSVSLLNNDNSISIRKRVNIQSNSEGSSEYSQYSIIDNYDINWSFNQFIEVYHIQEILSLIPILLICMVYLYQKIKISFDNCVLYFRDLKYNIYSIFPGLFIINKSNGNSVVGEEQKVWINPVPEPIKIVLDPLKKRSEYDWSNVKEWEANRIFTSKNRSSFEDKKYNLEIVNYLNRKIRKEENVEWKTKSLEFLWKTCERKGVNPNDISIWSSRKGNITYKHKDFLYNKEDGTIQLLERKFNDLFDYMSLSKIASGYQCQVSRYLKKEGIPIIEKNTDLYKKCKSEISNGNMINMDNIFNFNKKRKRSSSSMSIDGDNNINFNFKKLKLDSLSDNDSDSGGSISDNESLNGSRIHSVMDNYDINWSFSQFIELYPIQEIFSLLPVLFICIMYIYYKIKELFDNCVLYFRDIKYLSFSILPASVKSSSNSNDSIILDGITASTSNILARLDRAGDQRSDASPHRASRGSSNNFTDNQSNEWINPVPKPIKIEHRYDWSKVESWELERIKQSRWDTSPEYKIETLRMIDELNEIVARYRSSLDYSRMDNWLWGSCRDRGINPNDIQINVNRYGEYVLRHRDFKWLDETKNGVSLKEPRSYINNSDKMNLEKIAPGYECQMTSWLRKEGKIVADRGSYYERSELESNVLNNVNKRERSNTLSSQDSNNNLLSNNKKVRIEKMERIDSLKQSENTSNSSQHSIIDEFNIDCYNIDIPLYGIIEINLYYTILSFIFILCMLIAYKIIFYIKRLIYIYVF